MIAWEWTIEKAREGEEEKTEKKKTRKISQSAQVEGWGHDAVESGWEKGRGQEGWGQVGCGVERGKRAQGKEVGSAVAGRPGEGCRLRDLEPEKLQRAEEQRVA